VERNIREIHEIEEARKKKFKIKRLRSSTPKKEIYIAKNIQNSLIKSFKNFKNNSSVNRLNLTEKISKRNIVNLNQEKLVNSSSRYQQDILNSNKKTINDFSLNRDSNKNDKEKEFNKIISYINLQELQNCLDKDSRQILNMSEDIND